MFQITPDLFLASLPVMLKGMVGIFGVIAVIYITTALLNKIFTDKK